MSAIPKLNLKSVENNVEFKDWYGYSVKLEDAVRIQTERVRALEKDNDSLTGKYRNEQQALRDALQLNKKMFTNLSAYKDKYKFCKRELKKLGSDLISNSSNDLS